MSKEFLSLAQFRPFSFLMHRNVIKSRSGWVVESMNMKSTRGSCSTRKERRSQTACAEWMKLKDASRVGKHITTERRREITKEHQGKIAVEITREERFSHQCQAIAELIK